MTAVLVRMLERFGPLPEPERRSVESVPLDGERVEADRDLLHEGVPSSHCPVLLEGFACRYTLLEDGRRQILAFYVPGDPCDLAGLMMGTPSHSTCTLTPGRVALVPHAALLDRAKRHPLLNEALWRAALADAAGSDEWVINVGRRTAQQRTASLLCELVMRLHAAGPARGPDYALPLTKVELADALGLTPVHVGRTLQALRERGLAEFADGVLTVHDWPGLQHAAGFEPGRLHRPGSAGRGWAAP